MKHNPSRDLAAVKYILLCETFYLQTVTLKVKVQVKPRCLISYHAVKVYVGVEV
jgi:hypothetical protein